MSLIIRHLGQQDYLETFQEMVEFNGNQSASIADEIWFLQHQPVYTLGLAGKTEHLLHPGTIPVVRSDRGGQVTYHGPGQLLAYLLLDLQRRQISIKGLVDRIEQSIIDMLNDLRLRGERQAKAPGVYIDGRKIAALGIRVRNGCSYHGLALNVNLDLSPYQGINPCGYPGLQITRLSDYGIQLNVNEAAMVLQPYLLRNLGYHSDEVRVITTVPDSSRKLQAIA